MQKMLKTICGVSVVMWLLSLTICFAQSLPAQPIRQHPYLFCTPENIAAAKEKVAKDPLFKESWGKMHAEADRFLEDAKADLKQVDVLSLTYRMTGEARYADKVKDILLRECKKKRWGEKGLIDRTPPWNFGLQDADKTVHMAIGFDCIYDALSEQERKIIAQGLVRLGILPGLNDWIMSDQRIHTLDTMGHNWWSSCVFMPGIASLAVMNEEPRAREWLEKISEAAQEWTDYSGSALQDKIKTFDAGGGFYESMNYAVFALNEFLYFRVAWQNALGAKTLPGARVRKGG